MFRREALRSKNKFVQRERDRIRKDEEIADRTADLNRIKSVILKAEFECLGLNYCEKALKRRERTQQREMELWNTAVTLVRREALRRMLEQERQLHIRELSKIGLAIYQQRT
ncbi:hypothetical protein QQF64_009718 [Cirrhinus molitorella]|uniref:Uncharacterized protein n=2 Tax=Cirrhinus molitorella TaxID=172907 RepID=A0AA88U0V9_9TELE|nr:hypothetical protein Q8A67_008055 [Cirrhinus molitorella]